MKCMFRVSIPLRYAKNPRNRPPSSVFRPFQFLLGTLKTKISAPVEIHTQEFQFLLGTLKTYMVVLRIADSAKFQFLLGTLKTEKCNAMC